MAAFFVVRLSGLALGGVPWVGSVALCLPTAVDGACQYFLGIESTTARRVLTGTLAGVGLSGVT